MSAILLTREADDAYEGVVTYLRPDLRVVVCRDGLQWIVQRLAGGRWRAFGYCLTKDGLIRTGTRFLPRPEVAGKLAHLPDFLGRAA